MSVLNRPHRQDEAPELQANTEFGAQVLSAQTPQNVQFDGIPIENLKQARDEGRLDLSDTPAPTIHNYEHFKQIGEMLADPARTEEAGLTPEEIEQGKQAIEAYARANPDDVDRLFQEREDEALPSIRGPVDVSGFPDVGAADVRAEQQLRNLQAGGPARNPQDIFLEGLIGALDITKTLLSAGAAEIPATLSLLSAYLPEQLPGIGERPLVDMGNGQVRKQTATETGVANQEYWRDAMTLEPTSKAGKHILNGIASLLQRADTGAYKTSAVLSMGNPYAEAFIYSNILGFAEAAATLGGLKGGQLMKINKQIAEVEALAKKNNIPVDEGLIAEGIVEQAKRLTPNERDAGAPVLREALINLKTESLKETRRLKEQAQLHDTQLIDITEVDAFGRTATRQLSEEGHDLNTMTDTVQILDDIENFTDAPPNTLFDRPGVVRADSGRVTSTPLAGLDELETISTRIDNKMNKLKPTDPEFAALQSLSNKIDDFIQNRFDADMISGSPEAIKAWREFHQSRRADQIFSTDQLLAKLMRRDVTPEQLNNWLFGASAAKPNVNTPIMMERLVSLLGPDHDAIRGMRLDLLHRVAGPLFLPEPNFKQFISNYDSIILNRPSLVKAMGVDLEALGGMRSFAQVAAELKPITRRKLFGDFTDNVSRYIVGHGIARAGVRVKFTATLVKLLLGKTKPTSRDLLHRISEIDPNVPVIQKNSPTAGRLIQAAALGRDALAPEEDNPTPARRSE